MFNRLSKIRSFIGPEIYKLYISAIFIGLFWFITESSFIFILQGFLVSLGVMNSSQSILPSWYPESLLATSLILVFYGTFRSIIILYRNYSSGISAQIFNRYMRERFLSYGLNNVQVIPVYEIISLFNERIQQASAVIQYFTFFIINAVSLIFFFILGLRLAPVELLIGISLLALFLVPLQRLNKKIESSGKQLVTEWNRVSQTLVTGFKNYFFLKFYNLIDDEINNGKKSLRFYEGHYKDYHWLSSLKLAFPVFLGSIVISFVTYFSFKYWKTPGATLLAFYYIFIRLAQGASDTSTVLSIVKLNMPGFRILMEWHEKMNLYEAKEVKNKQFKKIDVLDSVSIDVTNVSFFYFLREPILKDISFKLSKGEILVIKGESGAGKSTLISLLAGFNKATSGNILINKIDLDLIQDSLLATTGYVGPEPYLIAGSIRENLLYGNKQLTNDDQLWNSLELAQLKKEVMGMKMGLDEPLNELTQLSTGQKQRLSIARALVRMPKLLILDEATANLDPVTEREFILGLKKLSEKITTIIISHKNSFDEVATHTLALKKL
ncbi:MAG: ATP-binding cassette domain-containing protein [Bacteriovoracaceae bacterium]